MTLESGRVTGCIETDTAAPGTAAEIARDCATYADPAALAQIFGADFVRARAIEVTMAMHPGDRSPPAPLRPAATRIILAEAVFTLAPDRRIAHCTARVALSFGARRLDLCAMPMQDGTAFAGNAAAFVVTIDATATF